MKKHKPEVWIINDSDLYLKGRTWLVIPRRSHTMRELERGCNMSDLDERTWNSNGWQCSSPLRLVSHGQWSMQLDCIPTPSLRPCHFLKAQARGSETSSFINRATTCSLPSWRTMVVLWSVCIDS